MLKAKSFINKDNCLIISSNPNKTYTLHTAENYASFGTNPISRYNRAQTDKQTLYKNTNRVDKKIV